VRALIPRLPRFIRMLPLIKQPGISNMNIIEGSNIRLACLERILTIIMNNQFIKIKSFTNNIYTLRLRMPVSAIKLSCTIVKNFHAIKRKIMLNIPTISINACIIITINLNASPFSPINLNKRLLTKNYALCVNTRCLIIVIYLITTWQRY